MTYSISTLIGDKVKKIILLIIFLFISVVLYSIDLSTDNNSGFIIIKCESVSIISSYAEVMINQSLIVNIKKGKYAKVKLNPGTYLLHAEATKESFHDSAFFQPIKVIVESGMTKYYKVQSTAQKVSSIVEVSEFKDIDESDLTDDIVWINEEV